MIEIKDLNKRFNDKIIFDNLNLIINDGEMIAVSGASGSGKTTLLNILGKLDEEYTGDVIIDTKNLKTINKEWMQKYSENIDAIDIIYIFRKIHVNASLWQKSARFI